MELVARDLQAAALFAALAARAEHACHAATTRLFCAFGEPAARASAAGFFVAVPTRRADARAAEAAGAVVAIGSFGLRRRRGARARLLFVGVGVGAGAFAAVAVRLLVCAR